VADPEISKREGGVSKSGGPPSKIAKKKSRILGLKSSVLLTFDDKFWAKRGGGGPPGPPSKSATFLLGKRYLFCIGNGALQRLQIERIGSPAIQQGYEYMAITWAFSDEKLLDEF
jgi:hypothetical protein